MRIVAGAWRGRALVAPPGQGTRPTADRVRQALFDMLLHAEWGGRAAIENAVVLDVFAGTGALGLEALSRGAATACFIEWDPAALRALRANVAACKAEHRVEVVASDALRVALPPGPIDVGKDAGEGRSGCPRYSMPVLTGSPVARPLGEPRSATAATGRNGPAGGPASLVFLDPPYGQNLISRALTHLHNQGRVAADALIVAETGRDETWRPKETLLAERLHGAARILIFRTA